MSDEEEVLSKILLIVMIIREIRELIKEIPLPKKSRPGKHRRKKR